MSNTVSQLPRRLLPSCYPGGTHHLLPENPPYQPPRRPRWSPEVQLTLQQTARDDMASLNSEPTGSTSCAALPRASRTYLQPSKPPLKASQQSSDQLHSIQHPRYTDELRPEHQRPPKTPLHHCGGGEEEQFIAVDDAHGNHRAPSHTC